MTNRSIYESRKNLLGEWEVGYYNNDKNWVVESKWNDAAAANKRASILNKIDYPPILGKNNKEQVNHPSHYNSYSIEVIDMMEKIWGKDFTRKFCEMNAFKYRMRMGLKDDMEQDLKKEQWYLKKAKELSN